MKKIFKYGTGDSIPENAQYLTSVVQEMITQNDNISQERSRFVWHYFLVEVKEEKEGI